MNNLLSALSHIDVATLQYNDWLKVGMALKAEGLDVSVWDEWSKADHRYRQNKCQQKWDTFKGSDKPITGATIFDMAIKAGWSPYERTGTFDWNDSIEFDGNSTPSDYTPTLDLIKYLSAVFEKDDKVGYVTQDAWQDDTGKWMPSRGVYDQTAGALIESLKKYPNDIGATIGDWKPQAGAWIRFNPLDGKGVKNENVTHFRYALVESDSIPIKDQVSLYQRFDLPIAAMVYSGGKSVHAIVHIDADDIDEYKDRVDFLYAFLEKHGVSIDTQNRNPSRLSRMPGVTRNGKYQRLIAVNIGKRSWDDWYHYVKGSKYPRIEFHSEFNDKPPAQPEELIHGILRRGHKMLISGPSKAGKSFMLMELCIALAEGKKWLGFECRKSRVLYVNLEIDPASCILRINHIYDALGFEKKHNDDIGIWNLRGYAVPLTELTDVLIQEANALHFDAIVIDPIYKVITGDENNASDMAAFCNQFDKIAKETGCSTIICHHHSKGAQGAKKAQDRSSGSGVFGRDPDAILDIIELEMSSETKLLYQDNGATAWQMECSLREFANFKPFSFWFDYPIHRIDQEGALAHSYPRGDTRNNLQQSTNPSTPKGRREALEVAFEALQQDGEVHINALIEYLDKSGRQVRRYIEENEDEFYIKKSIVRRKSDI